MLSTITAEEPTEGSLDIEARRCTHEKDIIVFQKCLSSRLFPTLPVFLWQVTHSVHASFLSLVGNPVQYGKKDMTFLNSLYSRKIGEPYPAQSSPYRGKK